MHQEGNTLPICFYEVIKILCLISMEYKKIHICLNDCILYEKEFEAFHKRARYMVSQYKVKDDHEGKNNTKGYLYESSMISSNHSTILVKKGKSCI